MDKKTEIKMIMAQILEIENQIKSLNERKIDLERQFDQVFYDKKESSQENKSPYIEVIEQSIGEKMKQIFKESPRKVFTIEDLMNQLHGAAPATVRATVSRLNKKDKCIKNVGRGQYRFLDKQ